jgi:hypothetical protein
MPGVVRSSISHGAVEQEAQECGCGHNVGSLPETLFAKTGSKALERGLQVASVVAQKHHCRTTAGMCSTHCVQGADMYVLEACRLAFVVLRQLPSLRM